MHKNIAVGIDIGTHKVKVVISEQSDKGNSFPKILGVGYAESKGLRHGYIIHQTDAVRSIRRAIRQAEKTSGVKVSRVFMSIGGIGLSSYISHGTTMITRADSEITNLDIDNVLEASQDSIPQAIGLNRKIIHTIPIEYLLDGKPVLGNPVGLKGVKLEARVLYIFCLEHHLAELIQAVEDAGVEIIDVMASPLAASLVSLSKSEKIAGCVLANIGSETVSIVVYENDIPISMEVFPIGSNDITNDIALGLKVSLDDAELIKIDKSHTIEHVIPKKRLEEIISARLSDIFELIEAHLKKINKNGLLPAGVVITGGGSGITTIEDIAKAYLKLPSKVSELVCDSRMIECMDNQTIRIKDSTWSVAYGLCVFGLYADDENPISNNIGLRLMKRTRNRIAQWIKQFLP